MACGKLDEASCTAREDCVIRRLEGGSFEACTGLALAECSAGDASADPEPCPGFAFPERDKSPYILPYKTRQTHNIRQGNCNATNTHNGSEAFAYDIEMPIGTPLLAARGGRVLAVIEQYTDDQHGLDQGNVIAIDHGDRTYAKYGHITHNGALVEVGDIVQQGDVIALSGNSGQSQGPHVHFAVKACPVGVPIGTAGCSSIPVSFRNTIPHPYGLIGSPISQIGGGQWYPACSTN